MAEFEKIKKEVKEHLGAISNQDALQALWRSYFGRKGILTHEFRLLEQMSGDERKQAGVKLNLLKKELQEMFGRREQEFIASKQDNFQKEWLDVTHPTKVHQGSLHPITQVTKRAEDIFNSMGFAIVEGPEIEDEKHNFEDLNIPAYHPARDMWDTFWLKPQKNAELNSEQHSSAPLMRTHTSPVQIRFMRANQPPFRIIAPGRVFRYEATDATHNFQFWQLEGLMVDKNISVANFKAVMGEFFSQFFQSEVAVRLRPGYFPFVEPGFEVDAMISKSKGQKKQGKWLELAGAGMVHPRVFEAAGYNPKHWKGFAFGMGLDRLALLRYGLNDVRPFYNGDVRFLKQFQ